MVFIDSHSPSVSKADRSLSEGAKKKKHPRVLFYVELKLKYNIFSFTGDFPVSVNYQIGEYIILKFKREIL